MSNAMALSSVYFTILLVLTHSFLFFASPSHPSNSLRCVNLIEFKSNLLRCLMPNAQCMSKQNRINNAHKQKHQITTTKRQHINIAPQQPSNHTENFHFCFILFCYCLCLLQLLPFPSLHRQWKNYPRMSKSFQQVFCAVFVFHVIV